jgi:hypothetical protein
MRRRKHGTLRSGKAGKGGSVKSRKQAIAIGLSEARKKGGVCRERERAAEADAIQQTPARRGVSARARLDREPHRAQPVQVWPAVFALSQAGGCRLPSV